MPISVKGLINGLQLGLDRVSPIRIYEAFLELERRIIATEGISGAGGRHYSRANSSAGLTIPTATPTALAFNQSSYQNNQLIHNAAVSNTKFTAQRDGMYFISGHIQWPINNIIGYRKLMIQVDGASIIASTSLPGDAVLTQDQSISTGVYLFAGQYIEIIADQTSGGNLIIPAVVNYSPEGVFAEF